MSAPILSKKKVCGYDDEKSQMKIRVDTVPEKYPYLCAECCKQPPVGARFYLIEPTYQGVNLCEECFELLKTAIWGIEK